MQASGRGELEIARMLLQAGAQIDQRDHAGKTALQYAVEAVPPRAVVPDEHCYVVNLLLKKGANPRSRDRTGQTVLQIAERFGHDSWPYALLSQKHEGSTGSRSDALVQ